VCGAQVAGTVSGNVGGSALDVALPMHHPQVRGDTGIRRVLRRAFPVGAAWRGDVLHVLFEQPLGLAGPRPQLHCGAV
jgi:hypothetical protein